MTILPPEKLGAYLREAEQYGVLPKFFLELSSGLRRGELLALRWDDLNVKDRILSVSKQVTRIDGELVVTEPKTKNSVRRVALSRQAVELLVREHEQHPDNPLLFPSPRTGGACALPRSPAHLRHHGSLQRCGCKDALQYVGPLQRRVHPGHLYPHHQRNAARRCGEDRRLYGNSHCQAGTRAARPAGGEPVQGDPVRESGVKELYLRFAFIAPGYRICFTINPWRLQ